MYENGFLLLQVAASLGHANGHFYYRLCSGLGPEEQLHLLLIALSAPGQDLGADAEKQHEPLPVVDWESQDFHRRPCLDPVTDNDLVRCGVALM
ncbi:hypothetical protein ACFX13_016620 [Malus domestica]